MTTPLSMMNAPWATLQPGMLGGGSGPLPSFVDNANQWTSHGAQMSLSPVPGMAGGFGATGTVAPNMGFFGNGQGLGFNAPTASMALSGLQTLAGLWGGLQQLKLAKKSFKFTKDMAETNLGNQMQSYNTALADRARSRGVMEGQTQGQVENYIGTNSLTRSTGRAGGATPSAIAASATSNYPGNPDRDPNG